MKDLTLSVVVVLVIALGIGLAFHWIYPRVNLTSELFGLFVFVAVALNWDFEAVVAAAKKARAEADK